MEPKKLILIGEFIFPSDYASALRVFNLAQAAKQAGYEPIIIGRGIGESKKLEKIRTYDGIEYMSIHQKSYSFIKKLCLLPYLYFTYSRILKQLNPAGLRAIAVYASPSAMFVPQIIRYCRRYHIKTVGDISEWYDRRQFKGGRFNPVYLVFAYRFRHYFHKIKNIMCCSTLVQDYFKAKGCNTIRIPALLDVYKLEPIYNIQNSEIIVLYAGQMGKKDIVADFILALTELKYGDKPRICLKVFGTSEDEFKSIAGWNDDIFHCVRPYVTFTKRVPREKILAEYAHAHFSILLRPNLRYANAGFPSKVAESLAMGVPVITNTTSDLALYIIDGVNGFLLKDYSKQTLLTTIEKIISLNAEKLEIMRRNARKTAEENFDYRIYSKLLKELIK